MAKNLISAMCLTIMVLVAGGVVGFYYYCGMSEKANSPALTSSIIDNTHRNEESVMTKSFFSHDVLKLQSVCSFSDLKEKPAVYLYELEDCFNVGNPSNEDYNVEEYVWNKKYDFNSLILANQELGYFLLLNEKMSLFQDIKSRLLDHQEKMNEILSKDSDRTAQLLDFGVEAIFDRQNPEIAYVLFSFNEQAYWPIGAEEINIKDEVLAYAAEIKIYKYNLKTDEFDVLYNAYEIKDNDTEKMVVDFGDLLIAPSFIVGINEKNDLMLSGGNFYWATGLGGSGYPFSFEGLNAYAKHYLLNSGENKLSEYKYTEDEKSYNAALYEFLMFDYYPNNFSIIGGGDIMEEYKKL